MWQNMINGFLGLWVVALAFLGFSDSVRTALLVLTGLAIAFVAFLGKILIKPTKDLVKYAENNNKKASPDKFNPLEKPQAKEQISDIKPDQGQASLPGHY